MQRESSNWLNGYYLKDWNDKKFPIKTILAVPEATGIGVRTGLHLLATEIDGETALTYAAELGLTFEDSFQRHRDDDPWRFMVLDEPTKAQIALLPHGQFQGKVVTKEAVKDANGEVIKKGEALEVFLTNDRQVLITGKHPDGGNYFWPRGYGPEDIKPPSDEVWNFVVELANQQDAPKSKNIMEVVHQLNDYIHARFVEGIVIFGAKKVLMVCSFA